MRYFFLASFLFLLPAASFAAEFRFEQQPISVNVGDTFSISLLIQTGEDIINAIEGSVSFPTLVSLTDIRLEGSLIPLWISPPAEKGEGLVSFAGVLPGGYQGDGNVFTLVFTAIQKGTVHISFGTDTKMYLNDGKGTTAKLSLPAYSFSIGASKGVPHTITLEEDVVPPEPFVPLVSSGEPFGIEGSVLVFTTQDKNLGIVRYDIARSYYKNVKEEDLSWHEAQSPYVFEGRDSTHYLYVRAVDRAGNTRVAMIPPRELSIMILLHTWWFAYLCFLFFGAILYICLRFYYEHNR